jgi:protoheme IX farnesyltransferase
MEPIRVAPCPARRPAAARARAVLGVFKLRIGVMIMATALVGMAVVPGPRPSVLQAIVLALAVLGASAAAGAFNQYVEVDTDRLMARTRRRAFVSGALTRSPAWLAAIALLLAVSVAAAWLVVNPVAALHTFLGAFFYGVVYTLWLKRRSRYNIVIGGLAGSFAVLAGAAAVDPQIGPLGASLALLLFLWTPPHFWSLAIANSADYRAAGVPMLPVVVGTERAARTVFASTLALVAASLLPAAFGAGPLYVAGASVGGAIFLARSWRLARAPSRATAMAAFFASLVQLSLVFAGATLDALLR